MENEEWLLTDEEIWNVRLNKAPDLVENDVDKLCLGIAKAQARKLVEGIENHGLYQDGIRIPAIRWQTLRRELLEEK